MAKFISIEQIYISIAKRYATEQHKGQKRRGGAPYVTHLQAVADSVEKDEEKQVAWLHDTIEDTDTTRDDLRDLGFSENVIEAVWTLTKWSDEDYTAYLCRVKQNPLALKVKLADIKHNLSDKPTAKQHERYTKALKFLMS